MQVWTLWSRFSVALHGPDLQWERGQHKLVNPRLWAALYWFCFSKRGTGLPAEWMDPGEREARGWEGTSQYWWHRVIFIVEHCSGSTAALGKTKRAKNWTWWTKECFFRIIPNNFIHLRVSTAIRMFEVSTMFMKLYPRLHLFDQN